MLVIAASSFYRTQNEAVFKAESSELKLRKKEDFSLAENENGYGENTLVKFFSDEKELSLKLNKQSIELLKSRFAENNFIDLANSVIGLSGSAASFVDSWYKDISINRNFLKADLNSDGKIEGNEFKLLRNSVKDFNENQDLRKLQDAPSIVLREAKKTQGYMQSKEDKALNLEDLLNQAIISDKNLDGKITRLEYAAQGKSDDEGYKNWALEELKNIEVDKIKAMIVDPQHTITPFFNGRSIYEIYDTFAGIKFTNAFENIKENSKQIETENVKKGEKDEEKEKLREFPELKSIIQNNPNISKESLEKIREKKKIASAYSQEDLKTLFSKTLLSFEKRA